MAIHHSSVEGSSALASSPDLCRGPRTLSDGAVTLRALRGGDAPSLLAHLSDTRVLRYVAPCPSTVADFRRFIRWTHAERRRGALACYGVVPAGNTSVVGVVQIWRVDRDFSTAEWGFVLGRSFWGTGLFIRSARLMLDMAFSELGVYRLEARCVDVNERGNGVLAKLGATRDGVLRGGFRDGDVARNHVMWSILAPEWQTLRARHAN